MYFNASSIQMPTTMCLRRIYLTRTTNNRLYTELVETSEEGLACLFAAIYCQKS